MRLSEIEIPNGVGYSNLITVSGRDKVLINEYVALMLQYRVVC